MNINSVQARLKWIGNEIKNRVASSLRLKSNETFDNNFLFFQIVDNVIVSFVEIDKNCQITLKWKGRRSIFYCRQSSKAMYE